MGSAFEFKIVADITDEEADAALELGVKMIQEVESIISSWNPSSEVSLLNRKAGLDTVQVSSLLYELIKRSIHISKITQGAFDISFSPNVESKWRFEGQTEDVTYLDTAFGKHTGNYSDIILLEGNKVFLKRKGMRIGFGAIGKGFVADLVKKEFLKSGITSGVVNASGDLTAWGENENGQSWNIGVLNPSDKRDILLSIPITEQAIATSGDYEKYFIVDGRRYAHIIDPKTGKPTTGIQSATVISNSAELSDALATSVFVLGVEVALDLINQFPHLECVIVSDDEKVHFSSGLEIYNKQ